MSEKLDIDVNGVGLRITINAIVSVSAPVLKRALVSRLAINLEQGSEFKDSREAFLRQIAHDITNWGTDLLSRPAMPELHKIPGGHDRLLRETSAQWQRMFEGTSETHFVVPVSLSLDGAQLTWAYACAFAFGIVDRFECPPATCDASEVLGYATEAYINYGEEWLDTFDGVAESDLGIAADVVARTLPFLAEPFGFGFGECVRLEDLAI